MKKSLLQLFAAFATLMASAQTKVNIDGICYNLYSDESKAEVISGDTKYSGSITIPATVTHDGKEYNVTSIGGSAFQRCSSLESITIPEGVTSIGDYAFYECYSLKAITIPENVTSIGDGAFSSCSLSAVHISSIEAWCNISFANYESNPLHNAHNLYLNGELVTALVVPESVTSIGKYAFYGCTSLTAITIPKSVTSIGERAFYYCSSLESITIPEGVTNIGDYAFYYCSSLESITIPEDVTSIGESVFYGCTSLESITIHKSVTSIGDYAFYGCTSLTDITIPESVTSIGKYTFYYCYNLKTITIPKSVTSIGERAFYGCSSLTDVHISSIEAWCNILFANDESNPLHKAHNLYLNGKRVTALVVPEGVTSIRYYAFYGCTSLESITIPKSVTSIGEYVFYGCTSLKSITIPESVTSIGDYAFQRCTSLETIIIPKGVTSIGKYAFAYCSSLTKVYCYAVDVPKTSSNAFYNSNIENATLHVPASALEKYKTTPPWGSFRTKESTTNKPVQSITLNQSSATLTEGGSITLTATVTPEGADDTSVTWSSSHEDVATVDNTGKVTAVAIGAATITATANDGSGVSASCEVTVTKLTEIKITINKHGSGTYCSEYALDFSQVEGLKAYAATGYKVSTGVVTLVRVMTTQPSMGIFLKGDPGEYVVPVLEGTDENSLNMLVGTLEQTIVNSVSDDGLYANYRYTTVTDVPTPMFYKVADCTPMSANRAYLQIPLAWLPQGATRSIGLRFDDEEDTTDMEDAEFTIDNSQLTIIYDLNGRRVTQPVKGSMCIVNGKKVIR